MAGRPALTSLTAATTLSDQAYDAIQRAIARGELEPGAKITERGLAEMLGVSPTPIREALQRLVHDKRIERVGPRTLRVAEFDEVSLDEIDEIEIELQVLAVRYAARKATDDDVARLRSLLHDADAGVEVVRVQLAAGGQHDERAATRAFAAVRRFHDEIEAIAGNTLLDRSLEQARAFTMHERRAATRAMTRDSVASIEARYGDHRELLDAIAAHDEEAAAEVMRRHTTRAHREIRRRL